MGVEPPGKPEQGLKKMPERWQCVITQTRAIRTQ